MENNSRKSVSSQQLETHFFGMIYEAGGHLGPFFTHSFVPFYVFTQSKFWVRFPIKKTVLGSLLFVPMTQLMITEVLISLLCLVNPFS